MDQNETILGSELLSRGSVFALSDFLYHRKRRTATAMVMMAPQMLRPTIVPVLELLLSVLSCRLEVALVAGEQVAGQVL